MKTLKIGAVGEEVKVLQSLLRKSGFFEGKLGGNFQALTLAAVKAFQASHMGPSGKYLNVDGEVGPATWWALENPNGDAQRSGIQTDPSVIPTGISEARKKILRLAIKEHRAGVAESPKGSNWGDGVTKYLLGVGPAPWCCYCMSWLNKQAYDRYPLGKRYGHCATFWRDAKAAGAGFPKAKYEPIPGDFGIILYGSSGSGHIFLVANVSADGRSFNTFAGNEGDRFKHGWREKSQDTIVGFINLFGDDTPAAHAKFKRQIFSAEKLASSLAATR